MNRFMTNSRFAGLVDDINVDKKLDKKLDKKNNETHLVTQYKDASFKDDFPALTSSNNNKQCKMDFSKLKEKVVEKVEQPVLGEGWVIYKRDPVTRITIRYSNNNDNKTEMNDIDNNKKIQNGSKRLVDLYEQRTNQFIEINGYDTWERRFKYPGWQEYEAESEEDTDSVISEENELIDNEETSDYHEYKWNN